MCVIISTKERHQRAAGGACAINSSANPARQIHISTDLEMQMSLCKLLRGVKRFSRCAQFVYLLGRDHLEMRHEKRVRAAVKFEANPFTEIRANKTSLTIRHFKLFAVNCRERLLFYFSTRLCIFILNVWQAPATRMQYSQRELETTWLKRETAVESTHSVAAEAEAAPGH